MQQQSPQNPQDFQTPQNPSQQPWAQTAPVSAAALVRIDHPWAHSPHAFIAPILLFPGRIRGKLSEYREGWIGMVPEGFLLSGKATPSADKGNFIKRVGIFFLFGSLLGTLIAEKVLIKPRLDALTWDCIEEIVLMERKGRMCLVYHLPDAPETAYSLGLRLGPPALFHQFAQAATHYIGPEKVHEGKIGPPSTPAQIWTAVGIVIVITIILIAAGLADK